MNIFSRLKDLWELIVFYKGILFAIFSTPVGILIISKLNTVASLQVMSLILLILFIIVIILAYILHKEKVKVEKYYEGQLTTYKEQVNKLEEENSDFKRTPEEKARIHDKDIFEKSEKLLNEYFLADLQSHLEISGQFFIQHMEPIEDYLNFLGKASNSFCNQKIDLKREEWINSLNKLTGFLWNNFPQVSTSHIYRTNDKEVLKEADRLRMEADKAFREYRKVVKSELII